MSNEDTTREKRDAAEWTSTRCVPLSLAHWVARAAPRGKGALPRAIGRALRPWVHHSMKTRHGALLPIVAESLDVYTSMLMQGNSWDYWVFRAMNERTRSGAVVYDVGANVGYLSVELAWVRKGDGVTVVAFEPQPRLADNVRFASELNGLGNLTVHQAAVGATDDRIPFFFTSHAVHATAGRPGEAASKRDVDQVRIDTMVAQGRIPPPSGIKIDIEGYEMSALLGARETISRFRPWVIFEYSWATIDAGLSRGDFVQYFAECGEYRCLGLGGQELSASDWILSHGGHRDVIAWPAEVEPRGAL